MVGILSYFYSDGKKRFPITSPALFLSDLEGVIHSRFTLQPPYIAIKPFSPGSTSPRTAWKPQRRWPRSLIGYGSYVKPVQPGEDRGEATHNTTTPTRSPRFQLTGKRPKQQQHRQAPQRQHVFHTSSTAPTSLGRKRRLPDTIPRRLKLVVLVDIPSSTTFTWRSPIRKNKAREARRFLRLYPLIDAFQIS